MALLKRILDDVMDWTVLPGFSSIGYSVRERLVPRGPIALAGRSVMVTGANSGIGEAACVELARLGATVHMVVRSRERGQQALNRIVGASGSNAIELHICDLSSLASVREFATGFLASGAPLDVLVNNAGVLPAERTHTDEGFELAFVTNVLAPFLLAALLLPSLRRSGSARIINVSSGGMYTSRINLDDLQLERREFKGAAFYAHTKRAEVILSEEWGRRLAIDGITMHSMHPGWVATAGVAASLPGFSRVMVHCSATPPPAPTQSFGSPARLTRPRAPGSSGTIAGRGRSIESRGLGKPRRRGRGSSRCAKVSPGCS